MTSEQQQQQACAELARRMGWTPPTSHDAPWPERFFYWLSPDGQSSQEDPPDYFTDPAASRELVAWLAADDARWQDFAHALYDALGKPQPHLFTGGGFYASLKPYLTAPPSVIARAACKALGVEVSE